MKYLILFLVFSFSFKADASRFVKNGFDLRGSLIPHKYILYGGPPKDGITSIDTPKFVSPQRVSFLGPEDRVLSIRCKGVAKAYPVKILDYHEIVNDTINSQPIAVTYCPLCGSGMAFKSSIDDQALSFGVSGLLYNSDVLLYDRNTDSLWSQIRKQAITGKYKGRKLVQIPMSNTTWNDWKSKHPDGLVLSIETGYNIDYRIPLYRKYINTRKLYYPVRKRNNRYHPKELVLGVEVGEKFVAFPFYELALLDSSTFSYNIGPKQFTVSFSKENWSARIFDDKGRLYPATTLYWFAWYAFHPETKVFEYEK